MKQNILADHGYLIGSARCCMGYEGLWAIPNHLLLMIFIFVSVREGIEQTDVVQIKGRAR